MFWYSVGVYISSFNFWVLIRFWLFIVCARITCLIVNGYCCLDACVCFGLFGFCEQFNSVVVLSSLIHILLYACLWFGFDCVFCGIVFCYFALRWFCFWVSLFVCCSYFWFSLILRFLYALDCYCLLLIRLWLVVYLFLVFTFVTCCVGNLVICLIVLYTWCVGLFMLFC